MTPTLYTVADLKSQAADMRNIDNTLSNSASLEKLAASRGFRDWNTLRASALPWSIGDMVTGTYLGQSFRGKILDLKPTEDARKLTLHFDQAVDVVTSAHFSNMRQRVSMTIDGNGVTDAKTSDGTPHLILD
ncbi:MAG: glyoxalase superfamily protein [Planktomarina sp.]